LGGAGGETPPRILGPKPRPPRPNPLRNEPPKCPNFRSAHRQRRWRGQCSMRAAADSHHPPVPENEFSQSSRFKRASKRLRRLAAIGAVWRDHLVCRLLLVIVEGVVVVGAVLDPILWLGFDPVDAEAELREEDFVMVGRMRAYR